MAKTKATRYAEIIERIFRNHHRKGMMEFEFDRTEIERVAAALKIDLPKNLGDLIYSFRFRTELPQFILNTAPAGMEWGISLAGRAKYRFRLTKLNRIVPSENAFQIKIPDATPEIIKSHAKSDEQALLAIVRYNRLIDIFLRVAAYSLQSHLRTSVPDLGQIEVDELYVGVRDTGEQFIIPIQAKGGTDRIGASQVMQDWQMCQHAYASLTPRLVAVQFAGDNVIVMFELAFQNDELRVVQERHYRLVQGVEISAEDHAEMRRASE